MEFRFESGLAELAGDGCSLMVCAERRMLFFENAATGKRRLSELAGASAEGGQLVVSLEDGGDLRLPFEEASREELEACATRLDACIRAWR